MSKTLKKISAILFTFLFIFGIFPFQSFASDELSLSVTYDAKCGEPTTFTLNADGGSGQYLYYFNSVSRVCEDGLTHVVDPTKLSQYQADNTFQFTFLASGTYRLIFYVMDKGATPITTTRQVVDIVLDDPNYPAIESIADKVAEECIQNCDTEFERALWLHDWLMDNCAYDYSYLYCGSEGAFARGIGTCETYHRAYTMLLNRVGIANGRIEGNGHVWTAVKIDGVWCQVDTTWDDNGRTNHSYENYLYFGLNDEITTLVHSDHSPNNGYESNSLENNYFIKTEKIHQWSDSFIEPIQQKLQSGEEAFSIAVTDSMPEGYKKVIYNLVAYQLSKENWDTETEHIQLDASYSNGELQFIAVYEPIIIEKEHTWDDGTITKVADCTTEGIKQYKCKNCDETKEEFIPALGHKIVTDVAVPATCTANGLTEGTHCSVCKTVLTKQQTVKPIGHKAVIDKDVPSTCLTDGKTIGSHCSVCNETLEKQETVSATGHSFDDGKITQFPTCTEDGIKTYYCNNCNEIKTEIIAKTDHTYKTTTTKATTKKNGSKVTKCSVCGAKKSSSTINAVKTITLSKTSYVYNGKAQKPSATVKDSKGKKIASSNYTVKYSNNKNVGIATVTITFKGNYSGTVKKTFTIKPKATTLSKVTAGKKKFTVKWKKQTTQTTGYQIQYSTNSKFTSAKTITASNSKTISKTVSKLKAKKKYYVRVRTYKIVGKTKICSSWSKAKSIKTK